jgi:hypothetical protein
MLAVFLVPTVQRLNQIHFTLCNFIQTGQLVQNTEVRLYTAWQHTLLISAICRKENCLKIKFRLRHRVMSVFMGTSFANDALNQVTVLA